MRQCGYQPWDRSTPRCSGRPTDNRFARDGVRSLRRLRPVDEDVDESDAKLRVSRSCLIPLDELEWRFTASGGPGGQHANTSNTKAEVRFDIEHSPSLGPRQRARLLERIGKVAR